MNIRDAIANINASSQTRNAAKAQSWGGYVHKTTAGLSSADITAGKFKVIFVQRDGDQYVFTDDNGALTYTGYIAKGASGAKGTGSPVAGTALELDATLLKAIFGDVWITGSMADFEAARNGGGEW